ncbi:MAG TPA: hypothetical protein VH370_12280 [Humisphaera sp.]|jgi:plasmid stability protein|nr:hypothetical protein [Humisphaera sp.]
MAANSTLTVPEGLFKELEERARAHGITVDGEAAELLAKALDRDKRESQLMSEIRKEREELARRGVFLTDDVIQQARNWGRE